MVMHVDVVVVGGGVMGSAAARAAARSGKSGALLEQFAAGHKLSAFHGTTRNFNIAYRAPEYLDLDTEARALWDGLPNETGTELLGLVGLVNHGSREPLRAIKHSHESFGSAATCFWCPNLGVHNFTRSPPSGTLLCMVPMPRLSPPTPPVSVPSEQSSPPAHFQPLEASTDWPSFNHSPDPRSAADSYWYSPTYGMFSPGES